MTKAVSSELAHCRELALRPGGLFEFTSRFLPSGQIEDYLILYALKQAICTIPDAHVDDAVKWEKLRWWGEELLAEPGAAARHPVLRACHTSGLRSRIDNARILRLVTDALTQIDRPPCSDESSLFESLSVPGQSQAELELSLEGAEIPESNGRHLGAASQLHHVILSFSPGISARVDSIPLNLLAKHNINTDDAGDIPNSEKSMGLLTDLLAINLDWFSKGLSDLQVTTDLDHGIAPAAHLQLYWAMQRRQLKRIGKDIPGFLESGIQFGPGDAWFAWRFLRKLA